MLGAIFETDQGERIGGPHRLLRDVGDEPDVL
jgi:hypothetical protein